MKVLGTYYSDTGNTEKVAKAIYEEVSKKNKADLKKVRDTNPQEFAEYDRVFLGSPIHSFDLPSPVKRILDALPKAPKYKLAGFITHMSPMSEKHDGHDRCFTSLEKVSKEKRIDFKGCYNCQGIPSPPIEEFIHKTIVTSDKDWKEYIEEAKKHPSSEDLRKAN